MVRHVIAALDDWRGRQPKKLSRPDAIRQIVTERLTIEGYLPRFQATKPPSRQS